MTDLPNNYDGWLEAPYQNAYKEMYRFDSFCEEIKDHLSFLSQEADELVEDNLEFLFSKMNDFDPFLDSPEGIAEQLLNHINELGV